MNKVSLARQEVDEKLIAEQEKAEKELELSKEELIALLDVLLSVKRKTIK